MKQALECNIYLSARYRRYPCVPP